MLTHEFMHHLFHKRIENSVELEVREKFSRDYEVFNAKKDAYKYSFKTDRSQLAKEYALAAKDMFNSFIDVLRSYTLEEMVIETILAEKFDSNSFSLVLEGQKVNGAAYIIISEEKASAYLDAIKDSIADAESALSSSRVYSVDLTPLKNEIYDIESEMGGLVANAQYYFDQKVDEFQSRGLLANGQHLTMPTSHECSHSKEVDELLEKIKH